MTPAPDRSLYSISVGVLAAHAAAMVASFFFSPASRPTPPPPPPKLLVKTISLKQSAPAMQTREEPMIAEAPPIPPPPEPEPIVEQAPPPPPEPTPEPPKPAPAAAPEPAPKPPEQKPAEPEPPKPEPKPEPVPKPAAPKPKPKPKKPKKTDPANPKPQPAKPKPEVKAPTPPAPAPKKPPETKKPAAPPAPVPQKKAAPEKKSEESKPAPVAEPKQPPGPPKPSAEEIAAQKRQQALIAQAKENIANIGKSRNKGSVVAAAGLPEGPAISHLESLHIEALTVDSGTTFTPQQSSYRDELANHLKLLLKLPEYGEVRIKLTLNRDGKVKKVEVIKAESSANRKQVENALPKLKFPPFGSYFGDAESYTFTISLRNE